MYPLNWTAKSDLSFLDGNNRTATGAAALFLLLNGRRLTASNTRLEDFTMRVVETKPGIAEMAAWLRHHSERTD